MKESLLSCMTKALKRLKNNQNWFTKVSCPWEIIVKYVTDIEKCIFEPMFKATKAAVIEVNSDRIAINH